MTGEICRLIIPVDANEQNPNKRRKLRDWIRAKMAHKHAAHVVWIAAGKPVSTSPVTVSVTIRRGRLLDEDNARASLKAVFDSLFKKAITPDDSPKWVKLGSLTQEVGSRWKAKPQIEIVVQET
jgi:hypothetical protein